MNYTHTGIKRMKILNFVFLLIFFVALPFLLALIPFFFSSLTTALASWATRLISGLSASSTAREEDDFSLSFPLFLPVTSFSFACRGRGGGGREGGESSLTHNYMLEMAILCGCYANYAQITLLTIVFYSATLFSFCAYNEFSFCLLSLSLVFLSLQSSQHFPMSSAVLHGKVRQQLAE